VFFFVTAQVNAKFVLQSINVFFYQIDTGCPKNALHVSVCYFKNEIQGKELLYLKMVQTQFGGKRKKKAAQAFNWHGKQVSPAFGYHVNYAVLTLLSSFIKAS